MKSKLVLILSALGIAVSTFAFTVKSEQGKQGNCPLCTSQSTCNVPCCCKK